MALTDDDITAKNFHDFYNKIKPYLNGGGMGMKLLWENSDPTQAMAGDTEINLSSDDYDMLIVLGRDTGSNASYSAVISKGKDGHIDYVSANNNGVVARFRNFTYVSDTKYTAGIAYTSVGTSAPSADNIRLVPYRIYGIKLYSREDKGNTYSTSERIVGEWIDGKAIYQRTYELNTDLPGNTSSPNYANITLSGLSSIGIDTLVDSSIVVKGKGTYANICLSDGYVSDSLNINNNNVAVSQSYTGNANVFTVLAYTIRYTKNT